MSGSSNVRVAVVIATTVDRFIGKFDFSALDEERRSAALQEIAALRRAVGNGSPLIDSAYAKLERALIRRGPVSARSNPLAARKLAMLLRALAPLAMAGAAMGAVVPAPAMAADPIPVVNVGDTVYNPVAHTNETVVEVLGSPGYAVRTDQNHIILLVDEVGQSYTATDSAGVVKTYTVTAVTTTAFDGTDYVTSVTVKDAADVESTVQIVNSASYTTPAVGGGDGTGSTPVVFPTAAGDLNRVERVERGVNGGDGRDGGGIRVCVPLIGCATIAYEPTAGGNGAPGPTVTVPPPTLASNIQTTADNRAAIIAASIGGNGGDGGDGYGVGIPGRSGGAAGNGGTVSVTVGSGVTIVTSGDNSQGIFAKSAAGRGGAGGSGYIASGGGSGGSAAAGGSASVYSSANIQTTGDNSAGILVQSLGGGSGDGGSSYGIVGSSGSGSIGGNGGSAYAQNGGTIVTFGIASHGVQAQSIGGSGGSSGSAGGLVAFGGSGGGAGTGGTAGIRALSTSSVTTHGDLSHGLFAQSVGGGGGSTGAVGGLVSLGGSAASGGTGGNVTITADDGSFIETHGKGAFGIFAESIGGSGGSAGSTGGLVTIGGSAGSGNNAGNVTVTSGATIITHDLDARGVFAQSVGGGGGSANGSGGLVSLGGSGSAGGQGGTVNLNLTAASNITTSGEGADGAFAQSIGGGGGTGASSGGLVALGGRGGSGGAGGSVTLTNAGTVTTGADFARGIFAQSIGGGGGSGGDSGGLVAIGGSGSVASSGGAVTIGNSGQITTGGNMSTAMQGQSIGGGGGDGGSAGGVLLTIGGSGAAGSNGGTVTANLSGGLSTGGDDSHGMFVQSVGGGGGNGGSATSVSAFVGVAIGGSGSSGGAGGTVDVNLSSQTVSVGGVATTVLPLITTTGDRSRGIFAQSVGGGGGSGGSAVALSAGAFFSASVAIGGSGGAGSQGGTVALDGNANVFTSGDNSQGIFVQSVGGGGGAGGFSVAGAVSGGLGFSGSLAVGIGGTGGAGGYGGSVTGTSGGNIVTQGMFSTGYFAQSVGGGGGAGGFNVAASAAGSDSVTVSASIGLGGNGGGGGDGGLVDVAFDGNISTGGIDGTGSDAAGFIAQSVGGGGGTGGFNVSAALGFSGAASIGGAIGLGGSGAGGGDGGGVTARVGSVQTTGDRSTGVLIQSVGGGGGSGGFNVSGVLTGSGGFAGGISVGLGGSGAGGGAGGAVTGTVTGVTRTSGDQSDAVVIQSLGGGGGSGAFNVSGNIALAGSAAGGISVGLGGSGGSGGSAGAVIGHVQDDVITTGNQSRGVLVQSAGGGGGGGAFNISGNLAVGGSAAGSVGVGLGGTGGDGGDGSTVIADAKSISTQGNDSAGFVAQSIGGGGGAGGFNVTGGISFSGTVAGSIGVGLGGSGGGGGDAATVDATIVGTVVTQGDRSGAILAQSVGGGGGSGGFNVSGDIAAAGTGAASVGIGLGGSGGTAGNAQAVTLNFTGAVQTGEGTQPGDSGTFSDGIVAQSIGGGGGNGGFNVTGNIAAAGTGAGQVGVGIGGHGGSGGSAGAVTLNVNDGVTDNDPGRIAAITRQANSAGIIAQSVGGGGGNGGFNVTGGMSFGGTGAGGINVGVGGSGGDGNSASGVTADISGLVQTAGDDSLGILAQSVGGGGGNGGFNVAGGLTFGTQGSGSVNVGIGGSGGDGGSAGAVTLRINDQIAAPTADIVAAVTAGDRSAGLVAQSLGGGGGNGGFNVTGGINVSGGFTGGANVGVGGMGGEGGNASAVIADITGAVGTAGDQSGALLIQSVGGGGGNGAFNVTGGLAIAKDGGGQIGVGIGGFGGDGGEGGDVTLNHNMRTDDSANTLVAAATAGAGSDAIIVQSLGGGGGNGGFNVTGTMNLSMGAAGGVGIGVGGFGGGGGTSGVATASIRGDVITTGMNSDAVLVQSVGGGGGNGGFNVTAGLSIGKTAAGNLGVGIGGFGGDGGSGNAVISSLFGDVSTLSDASTGVTVQSLGGGGGNGGFNVTGALSINAGDGASGNLGVGLGGFGGSGGSASTANSTVIGNITTQGASSYGLLVQSLGGGGGNGGFNVTAGIGVSKGAAGNAGVGIGGFGGDGGSGSSVASVLTGDVTTLSHSSSGVTVQSLGGGGGNGGFNVTGAVSVSASSGASGNLGVGIGGFGGAGGEGSSASSTITGNIITRGSDSHGLLVQSLGGGGGNGGFNVTGGLAVSSQGSAGNLGVGIGGFGGDGGNAGDVTSVMTGNIGTGAADQNGLLLISNKSSGATIQSVGGGGGNGAFNVTGGVSLTMGSSVSGNVGIGIGGFGGAGGDAGTVTATQTGSIVTRGDQSYGILVQSAGGGGGNGGFNVTGNVAVTKGSAGTVGVGIGGFGGDGGAGNTVVANLTGDIFTNGHEAYGATVQSLGGAGGAGGMNITGNMTISAGTGTSIAASVGIGGFGGAGGNAGAVSGSATGLYVTTDDASDGILVQSAGGGGGAGGLNVSGSIALSSGTTGSGAVGIGGFGGGGGDGSTVSFIRTGDTYTAGANSNGVTIQSIGGGGGRGGINVSGGIAATKGSATSVNFGLGGFGGDGGIGGDVTAEIYGNVIATGLESDVMVSVYDLSDLPDEVEVDPSGLADLLVIGEQRIRSGGSTGILVQSVGGGGGNGGLNVTGSVAVTAGGANPTGRAAAIGIGGFGGSGGSAGNVTATVAAAPGSTDRIQVQGIGDGQMAFAAQSIGGGGGAGGVNISGGISTAGQLTVGIGGFGGAGGTAGNVDAFVDADLFVAGNNAIGFLAQSIGGGGGAGAINISGAIQAATKGREPVVAFGLGGFGGAGNTSGNVTAVQNGQVMVEGQFAYGVLAQSVGGGGGAGGMNISAAVTGAGNAARKTEGIAISAGIGGNGGTGADAGNVSLTSDGNVFVNTVIAQVDGELVFSGVEGAMFAPGVVAQSIGGGGGAGGMNVTGTLAPKGQPIAIGVGGTGGVGGDAGDVVLTRGYGADGPATIMTYGQGSHGLVAQSIGGGGGNAGFNLVLAANKSKPKNPQYGATVTVGGDGGASGDGGDVEVQHRGDIFTQGGGSNGILAQSISNGGGSGATNITGALMKDSSVVSLAIGGRGGDGGNSGNVTVTHDGTIVTEGASSAAIRAQSIGSGGGDVSAEEDLTAFFDEDWPIDVAIPIGPKNEISVGIGDVGGRGGTAGDVTVNAAGTLITMGTDAPGIHAQSIGGSGGSSGTTSVGVSGENKTGSQGGGVSVAVGLEGGEGGVAGDVTVNSSAQIATIEERSRGIFAQSIGGSGGSGGDASNDIENASNEMHISVGGPGGSGSQAGNVEIVQTGRIDTLGDDADGILAQSIGGGGGAGGASGTQNLQYLASDSNTLAIAVGGSGGNGAVAGDVSVINSGIVMTSGDKSFGIRAQSIGGGGGVGGAVESKKMLITGTSNSLEFNVGGSGGDGSQAGDVIVINEGLIWTTGRDAAAISANSIGGGGGDAGSILDLSVSAATANTFKANIGGTGGSGGLAGDVTVINRATGAENSGYLITEGDGAYGIFAQSLGGSGGNSSTILSISVDGGAGSISAGFNFGNVGGTGNLGGDVLVDNGGYIDTSGQGAHGILAQSIGGGGGNGGVVLSGNLNLTNPLAAPLISIGGSGGDGGDAGNVAVLNSGSIVTRGTEAHGIVAQSIGGGGGNAGVAIAVTGEPGSLIVGNTLAATLGATMMTGTGGEGGTVSVRHTGDITVLGEGSQAIVAQSINGGGGTLTLDLDQISAIFAGGGSTSAQAPDPLVVARSGSVDSNGMAGGKVTVDSSGTIGVGGTGGVAINLQSIGGGGGTTVLHGSIAAPVGTASAAARTTQAATNTPVGFDISLGAVNGSGNMGGDIAGQQEGDITVAGGNSLGLAIQSIGGGGGRAIGTLEVEDLAQLAGSTLLLGGANQTDSAGGNISHVQDGTILALGDFSIGGLIQSIGGGGGVASLAYSQVGTASQDAIRTAASATSDLHSLATPSVHAGGAGSVIVLGASGGSGNNGGSIDQTLTGGAVAAGDHSAALVLQSVGAGGGVVTLSGQAFPHITLGGSGGAQGDGGDISLANSGTIGSLGAGGYGVILQSIGGGGGAVFGDFTEAGLTLASDNSGDGGTIVFNQIGDIAVLGDSSIGVLAQSLGGGGGFVDGVFAGTAGGEGAGGAVTLDIDGSVMAWGADSTAVLAQSLGSLGGGDIRLFANGDIRGGSGTGLGVSFEGGADNFIDIGGTLSAVSGLAIRTTTGNDTVENRGTIIGDVYLGEGTNLIHNGEGATFFTIDVLDLQDGGGSGTFVNDGSVELGLRASRYPLDLLNGETFAVPVYEDIRTAVLHGTEVISQVALDGDFRQSATGEIWYDVAFGPYASDRLDVTGDAAVAGAAHITLTWLENDDPVTLISTGGTGIDLGLDVPDTIALDYNITAGADGIQLGFDSDFGQHFLNANQQELGKHMDSALAVGGAAGLGRLLALLGNLSEGQEEVYRTIFDELDPEALLSPAVENLDSARAFSGSVLGCDPARAVDGASCIWGAAQYHSLHRDSDDSPRIALDDGLRLRVGAATAIAEGWSLGAALGYDALGKLRFDTDRASGEGGDAFHVGIGVARTFGSADRGSAGFNLATGWQKMTLDRRQDVFEPLVGTSRVQSRYLAANADVGYSFGSGLWFVRPNMDISAIRLSLEGHEESGLEGHGMRVDDASEWFLAVEPKLTVGARSDQVYFAVSGGGLFSNRDSIGAPMRFQGADVSADPALIRTMIDQQALVGEVELGVKVDKAAEISAGYEVYLGSTIESHTASVNLRIAF